MINGKPITISGNFDLKSIFGKVVQVFFCSDPNPLWKDGHETFLQKLRDAGAKTIIPISVLGGPFEFARPFKKDETNQFLWTQLELGIAELSVDLVIIINHQGCKVYQKAFPKLESTDIDDIQIQDLQTIKGGIISRFEGKIPVMSFYAQPDGDEGKIIFEKIEGTGY